MRSATCRPLDEPGATGRPPSVSHPSRATTNAGAARKAGEGPGEPASAEGRGAAAETAAAVASFVTGHTTTRVAEDPTAGGYGGRATSMAVARTSCEAWPFGSSSGSGVEAAGGAAGGA